MPIKLSPPPGAPRLVVYLKIDPRGAPLEVRYVFDAPYKRARVEKHVADALGAASWVPLGHDVGGIPPADEVARLVLARLLVAGKSHEEYEQVGRELERVVTFDDRGVVHAGIA